MTYSQPSTGNDLALRELSAAAVELGQLVRDGQLQGRVDEFRQEGAIRIYLSDFGTISLHQVREKEAGLSGDRMPGGKFSVVGLIDQSLDTSYGTFAEAVAAGKQVIAALKAIKSQR